MKPSTSKIQATLNKIVNLFETGDVPQAIAIQTFPPYDVPSEQWSLLNRIIMFIHDSGDCRGIKQWNLVGRKIKKGSKALYILAPKIKKVEKDDEDKVLIIGFIPVPVFRMEDTAGKDLEYKKISLPSFPLLDVAKRWGIDVGGIPFQGRSFGYYTGNKIRLATPEESVFFHEIAHCAHERVEGKLQPGQDPRQEVIAELTAQVLAQLVGTSLKSPLGNGYEYIKMYAYQMNKSIGNACFSIIGVVEKVLLEIFR